jgi:hypothetical protein
MIPDNLTAEKAVALITAVHDIMRDHGEWNSDTTQAIANLLTENGFTFDQLPTYSATVLEPDGVSRCEWEVYGSNDAEALQNALSDHSSNLCDVTLGVDGKTPERVLWNVDAYTDRDGAFNVLHALMNDPEMKTRTPATRAA